MNLWAGVFSAILASVAASAAQNDARAVIEHSVQVVTRDWQAAPEYECFERDFEPNGSSKTFEDLMIIGSPYQRLVAVSGDPLPQREQEEEQRKLDETIAQRQSDPEEARRQRIAKYERDRSRDFLFLRQLTKAFNFTLVGQRKLGDYWVYVLKAIPRRDYQPPNAEAQVLRGMRGTLWIDKKTYQWVRVEAHVTRPVWIEGFLAKVEPGTRFELDKMPVDDDIWLPKHYVMKARAKVLFLFSHKSAEDDIFYDYRKIAPTSRQNITKQTGDFPHD